MQTFFGIAAGSLLWLILLAEFPMFTICATLAVVAWLALSNR